MTVTLTTYEECWGTDFQSFLHKHPVKTVEVPNAKAGHDLASEALDHWHHGDCAHVMYTITDDDGQPVFWGVIGCPLS